MVANARSALALPLVLLTAAAAAQEPTPTFPSEARVVVLDVVATDAKGHPVADLRQDELQVFEDGEPCETRSFRLVRPTPRTDRVPPRLEAVGRTPRKEPATTSPTPARPNLVVLVFDRLSAGAAPRARHGALAFLAQDFPADTWFAVYSIRSRARALASFTTDRTALRAAIEAATSAGTDLVQNAGDPDAGFLQPVQALDSYYALMQISENLGSFDGRKSVVYFAGAWQLPTTDLHVYDELVNVAARTSVAIHTADARGLTPHKPVALTPMDTVLDAFTAESRAPGSGAMPARIEANGGLVIRGSMLRGSHKRVGALIGTFQEHVADDTGGLAIAHTNDLGRGLARVVDELRQYYEVAYAPSKPDDGRFRRIRVETSRSGVRLRTRKGYYATPRREARLTVHELPLIEALGAQVPARDFPVHVRLLPADTEINPDDRVIVIEVPLSEVTLPSDEARGVFLARLALFGYVRDENGGIVARLSHDWPIEGPLDEIERARLQDASFRVRTSLRPGRYVLEAVVRDEHGGETSVVRTLLEASIGQDHAMPPPSLPQGK